MKELNTVFLFFILLNLCLGYPRLQFDGGGGTGTEKCETLKCKSKLLRTKRNIIGNSEFNYLTKFGYLPQSILETGALTTDEQLRSAIRLRVDLVYLSELKLYVKNGNVLAL